MYNKFRIVFDPEKNKTNLQKHAGVSLQDAREFDWEHAIYFQDTRQDYGECRMLGIGTIAHRLFVVVFVDRGYERRIISLRKANSREVQRYAET